MKLKQAIENLGQANSVATTKRSAQALNIPWTGSTPVIFDAITRDLKRVPGNIGGKNRRASLRISNPPGAIADLASFCQTGRTLPLNSLLAFSS